MGVIAVKGVLVWAGEILWRFGTKLVAGRDGVPSLRSVGTELAGGGDEVPSLLVMLLRKGLKKRFHIVTDFCECCKEVIFGTVLFCGYVSVFL